MITINYGSPNRNGGIARNMELIKEVSSVNQPLLKD